MVGVAYAKEIGLAFAEFFSNDPDVIKRAVSVTQLKVNKPINILKKKIYRLIVMLLL